MKRGISTAFCLSLLATQPHHAAPAAPDLLKESGFPGGLAVVVGCENTGLLAGFAKCDGWLVHGLDTDPDDLEKANAALGQQGLAGRAAVARFDGRSLPYVDNLVNLLVAEKPGEVATEEILRVLRPGGVADIGGERTVKPRPDEIDEWTHYLHGPDNNAVAHDRVVGSPAHVQWVGGPKWARHHNHLSSTSAMVTNDGRLFSIVDLGSNASMTQPPDWQLVTRDAFNGIVLWQRKMGPWEDPMRKFRSGPIELPRRLVATSGRVFVTLGYGKPTVALDASNGRTLQTYAGTEDTLEILCANGALYLVAGPVVPGAGAKRIMAVDIESGRRHWSKAGADTADVLPSTLCVADGRVLFQSPSRLICLDAETGAEVWKSERPTRTNRISWSSPTLLVSDGVVLSADRMVESTAMGAKRGKAKEAGESGKVQWTVTSSPRAGGETTGMVIAFDLQTGRKLWECPTAMGYCSAPDVFVLNGLAWVSSAPGRNTIDFTEARDLRTGKITRRIDTTAAFTETHHHRCYRNKATDRFILLGRTGVELIDIEGDADPIRNCWVRGACQYGILPANGLLYTPPHSCACYIQSKLSGMWALAAPRPTSASPVPDQQRLHRGPAFGTPSTNGVAGEGDWPTFRGDSGRSGRATAAPPRALQTSWKASIGGKLTSPVIADGRLFVAATDAHTLHALDADHGKPLWQFVAGGRIDSPPTVHPGGLVLFGCADGFVYCLRATDGRLSWKFLAAQADRRTVSFGRLESVWPVTGSVLLLGDTLYCTAGRSSFLDGGMTLYRLDAMTGEVIGRTVFDSLDPRTGSQREEIIEDTELPGALPDVLVHDGKHLYLRDKVLDLEGRELEGYKPHLYCSAGLLDDTWWHRTYWLWGERTWGRASGWSVIPNYRPSGRILVTDQDTVFGFGRRKVSGGHGFSDRYHLFRADKQFKTQDRVIKNNNVALAKYQKPAKVTEHWSREIPLVARALVLAGDTLYAAGPELTANSDQEPAFDRETKGLLMAFASKTGRDNAIYPLDSQPVFDGMAAAGGRLFLSLTDGAVVCFGKGTGRRVD